EPGCHAPTYLRDSSPGRRRSPQRAPRASPGAPAAALRPHFPGCPGLRTQREAPALPGSPPPTGSIVTRRVPPAN
ncbi:Hypothetical predicted protein, partial [Marmota monax]